jgi:hypothetical protein
MMNSDRKIRVQPIRNILHEVGFAYSAKIGNIKPASSARLTSAVMLEDGVPLPGPANAARTDISQIGQGRFSFWHNVVYFSATDNSDPRTNGREYAFQYTSQRFGKLRPLVLFIIKPLRVRKWLRWYVPIIRYHLWNIRSGLTLWGVWYWVCFINVLRRGKNLRSISIEEKQ